MPNKIQFKRGLKADLPSLGIGEPAFCTDTKELFMGTASGNAKMSPESINVKWFGAKGDNTTDDYSVINSLLGYIGNDKTDVYLPKGTYIIGTNITIPANVNLIFANGAIFAPKAGITVTLNCGIQAGLSQIFSGDGTITGKPLVKNIYPQWFGALGDGITDDTTAFQKAITFCIQGGTLLYVPRTQASTDSDGYILSDTLNINLPMNIICDPLSILNWENMTDNKPGINIDYGDYGGHKGTYKFGILQGNKSYTMPGGTLPSGHYGTAVRIANGDIIRFYAKYISYWNVGILVEAVNSGTYNEEIEFDVCDDCQTGIKLNATQGKDISVSNFKFNTIGLSKYPIYLCSDNQSGSTISDCTFNGVQLYSEYPNGACIYSECSGAFILENIFKVKSSVANSTPYSLQKHNTVFKNPIVSGTTIFNTETGFFRGDRNVFELGVSPYAAQVGDPVKIKIYGVDNKFKSTSSTQQGTPGYEIVPSSIQGESNFNGGFGSAIVTNQFFCKIIKPDKNQGDITKYYDY